MNSSSMAMKTWMTTDPVAGLKCLLVLKTVMNEYKRRMKINGIARMVIQAIRVSSLGPLESFIAVTRAMTPRAMRARR